MDVWEYFASRDREVVEQSAAWDEDIGPPYTEELGSGGQRGRVWGRLLLTDKAFVQIHEVIEVTGTGVHRVEYAYYLIYDGAELWAEERDPTHDPAIHRHDRYHRRLPSSVTSFKDFLTKSWHMVSAEEDLRAHDEEA